MSIPTIEDKNSMANILRAMGDTSYLFGNDTPPATPNMPSAFGVGDIDPVTGMMIEDAGGDSVPNWMAESIEMSKAQRVPIISEQQQDMKRLLELFSDGDEDKIARGVERATSTLLEDSEVMPVVRRAINTERTNDGVRIGGWRIVAEGSKTKKYHVESVHSGQQIAKNLYLYEAAEALVNYLNAGAMINNLKVQNILRLEMEYAKHIEDAIQHKHACSRAIDRGDDSKLEISKVRFNESKVKAMAAKQKLTEHLGN